MSEMIYGSQEMSTYNLTDKYVQYRPDLQRRETYAEANIRVMDMHRLKYADVVRKNEKFDLMLFRAQQGLLARRALGSQRVLQFGGDAVLRKPMRAYNCAFSYADRPEFFNETLWLLLCGVGVGFSVQTHHVAQLPRLITRPEQLLELEYVILDTIEGWAEALKELLAFYFGRRETKPLFDYSEIRPKGAPLSTGGKAPGPDGLRRSLEQVDTYLWKLISGGRKKLRPLEAADIMLIMSEAVLSGGIRRSALIVLFSPDDEEIIKCKTGGWYEEAPWRARANFSMVLVRENPDNLRHFKRAMRLVREFGEPGFIFTESTEHGFNP